jgi:putative endonuclease
MTEGIVIAGLTRNPPDRRHCHCGLDPQSIAGMNMETMNCFVYLMASRKSGTLYVGVTSNLVQRVYQHKNGLVEGFTGRYDVHSLVWFESTPSIEAAIHREKQIKNWKRLWKIALIEKANPDWLDLYETIL